MSTVLGRHCAVTRAQSLHNAWRVDANLSQIPLGRRGGALAFGHMSNLCAEKGIAEVERCFQAALAAGLDGNLHLAGPVKDGLAVRVLEHLNDACPKRVCVYGYVTGERQRECSSLVQLLRFPSSYRNETQSVVLLEAMAAGAPVIAYAQCNLFSRSPSR